MIHPDNGALMAAVKIILDQPALSWPRCSVCLSISLTSISLLSHNPLCHSLEDSESLQHAGLGHRAPDNNPAVKHLLSSHSKTQHLLRSHQLWHFFLSFCSRFWPTLTLSLSVMQGETVHKTADAPKRSSLLGYLAPFIFPAKRQSHLHFKYLQSRAGSTSVYSHTKKMVTSCKDNECECQEGTGSPSGWRCVNTSNLEHH